MNGAIFSAVFSLGIGAFLLSKNSPSMPERKLLVCSLLGAIASNLLVWLSWKPSDATTYQLSLSASLQAAVSLLPANMFAFSTDGTAWKAAIIGLLIAAACYVISTKIISRTLSFGDLIIALAIAAGLSIVLAVSIGRSQTGHLVFHYGNLTILLPIASWIVVSKALRPRQSLIIGCLLTGLYTSAYVTNLEWRSSLILAKQEVYRDIDFALHQQDPAVIVDRFPEEFLWSEEPALAAEQKRWIIRSLNVLRERQYQMYSVQKTP
jgi:hypothetical protein